MLCLLVPAVLVGDRGDAGKRTISVMGFVPLLPLPLLRWLTLLLLPQEGLRERVRTLEAR